jgi:serine/threonine-protein kinase
MTSPATPEAPSSDSPRSFGQYRVVRRIGSGGMATVFEAEEERLGQRVAVKVLHKHLLARAGATERFLREGRAVARIRHPHVVQVLGVGPDEMPYLAMELLDGEDLGARLERAGRLEVRAALDVVLPTLAGIAAAHDAGVIHRDLKPSNIFLSRLAGRQWPKVVDFGISKVVTAEELTASDAVLGTVAYMAPEQARSVRGASFSSDQYSMAVVLYECVAGALPFSGAGVFDLVQAIMTAPVVAPSQVAPDVPAALDAIILRAMDRDPEKRFASIRAFASALLPFASESAQHAYAGEFDPSPAREEVAAVDRRLDPNVSPLGFTQTARLTVQGPTRRRWLLLATPAVAVAVLIALLVGRSARGPTPAAPVEVPAAAREPSPPDVVVAAKLVEVEPPAVPAPAAPSFKRAEPATPVPRSPSPRAGEPRVRAPATPSAPLAGTAEACRQSPQGCTQLGHNDSPILP